jgi:tetratricopeptide (TPR) repeat protein
VKERFDYDWFGAETDYNWAIGLNPSYATAHQWYGAFLRNLGRLNDAIQEMQRARELDPLSLPINTSIGLVFYLAKDYDKAIEHCRKTLEIDPNFHWAHEVLAKSYLQKGLYEEAISEFQKALTLSGGSEGWLGELAHAFAVSGRKEEALKILHELLERSKQKYVPKYEIALIYTALGERDQAFEFLDESYNERSSALVTIKMEPRYDPLRSDPRFITLLEKMRLE